METERQDSSGRGALRPLSKKEIDRGIERVFTEVADVDNRNTAADLIEADVLRPKWISAAELLRRMRPFLVLN